jgi:hypothetical protein
MSSNAGITIHGLINSTHTSQLNAQYAPSNIPTPWPLVVFSSLLSFGICCFGAITASRSLGTKIVAAAASTSLRIPGFKRFTKPKKTTTSNNIQLQPIPPYAKNGNLIVSSQKAPAGTPWTFSTATIIYYLTFLYCIFRAIIAFITAYKSLHDATTPLPAPSSILLILLSTQILYTNISHSPLPRLLLLLATLLLSISFGISSYAPNHGEWWPRYSTMFISSSNCAVYAGDCLKQAPHWLSVGCGNWSTPTNYDSGVSYGYPEVFYLPYQNTGDLNVQTGMNTLHATEMTVVVAGSAWWVIVLLQTLEGFELLGQCFKQDVGAGGLVYSNGAQRSVFGALKNLFRFRSSGNGGERRKATAAQQGLYKLIISFGLFLAFLVMLMAIGGHASQMMKKLSTTYLESFGPQVGTNFTYSPQGVITASEYWGNETSWSDCFRVRAPGSRSGFWGEWVESNRRSGALFRIAAGL